MLPLWGLFAAAAAAADGAAVSPAQVRPVPGWRMPAPIMTRQVLLLAGQGCSRTKGSLQEGRQADMQLSRQYILHAVAVQHVKGSDNINVSMIPY
jgi:hypothetical protein